jgi:hypothetical protein
LIQGAFPIAHDGEQLKEESPVAAVVRLFADVFFQILERIVQLSFTDQMFCAHWTPLSNLK